MDKPKGPTITIIGTGRSAMETIAAIAGEKPPKPEIKDPITTPPVMVGPHGRAWRVDMAGALKRHGIDQKDDACLDHWIVEAPWAHPLWHSYSIVVLHLRPMGDGRKTLVYLEGATHEIWVYAIDPNKDRNKMLTGEELNFWLVPGNYAGQFIEVNDDLARERIRKTVQEICDGALSPDTDFRRDWIARFGDHLMIDRANPRPPEVRR